MTMLHYAVQRLLHAIPILAGVSVLVFVLVHLMPGNAIDMLVPPDAPQELVKRLMAMYGLDQPLYAQYLHWLAMLVRGDLGYSLATSEPVARELGRALANTFLLAIPAAVLGFSLGTLLGTAAAFRQGKLTDKLLSALAITGVSLPHYWFAIVLVAIFSVSLNWLPAQGMGFEGLPGDLEQLGSLVLPVLTLSLIPLGVVGRVVRASVLDVLNQEFVSTLHAKGLVGRRIVVHILKNTLPPVFAVMGMQLGYLLGGSIMVETVFNWPGSGNLLYQAILRRDVPVIQATIVVLASFFVLMNLLVDIAQALVDPRIRR